MDGVELHAPGLTQVSLSGHVEQSDHGLAFTGPGTLDSADADTLLAWLSGRGDTASAGVRTLRARGDVTIAGDRLAVDGLNATLDQDNVQGRFAYTWPASDRPAIVEADLHATKLDLDALAAFAKSAVDENGFAPPRQGSLALDIGKATLAGVDARTVKAQIKFDAGALQIEHLSVGELGGAALDISGRIDELSSQPRGRVTVDLNAGTLVDLSRVLGQFAPQTADVLRRAADRLAPAKLHGTLTVERAPTAGSTAKLDLDGQLGLMRVALSGAATGEPAKLGEANVRVDSRLDADDGTALATLFGLDHVVAVDQLPGRVTLSAAGPLNGELRVDGEASASGFTAAVRGAVRLNGKEAPADSFQGTFQVLATAADLRPLQQAMTGQPGNAVPVSARAALPLPAAHCRSRKSPSLPARRRRTDILPSIWQVQSPSTVTSALTMSMALGSRACCWGCRAKRKIAAGPWSSQPLGGGTFAAMNGAVTFTLDHAVFAPALIASNLKGVAQFRPAEIALQNIDGGLAGGRVTGELVFRRNSDGLVSHGHIALADADAATVLQTDKKIIDARLTLKADFDSFGANPAALVRAAHGSGAIALADAHIAGLDPVAFVAAMHAADQGTAIELAKIQPAVNAALASGHLAAPQGDAAMMITDGKVSVANVMVPAQDGAALALAGALDLNTGAVDARMTLTAPPPAHALIRMRPELAVSLNGPLAAPVRSLDVSALTGWLTLRAAELQTRRLESIEANGRQDVIGRAVRPDFPVVRPVPAGGIIEFAGLASASPPGARGLDLLQTEAPAAAVTGSTAANKPRPAPQPAATQPAAPQTAGPPLDLLFRPQD